MQTRWIFAYTTEHLSQEMIQTVNFIRKNFLGNILEPKNEHYIDSEGIEHDEVVDLIDYSSSDFVFVAGNMRQFCNIRPTIVHINSLCNLNGDFSL